MDRGDNNIISTNTKIIVIIINKNRCDIGLFCCEFLEVISFKEVIVTACSDTVFLFSFSAGLKAS